MPGARGVYPLAIPPVTKPGIHVSSADPAVAAAVLPWAAALELDPPAPVTLEIVVGTPGPDPGAAPTFSQPHLSLWTDQQGARLTWDGAPVEALLPGIERRARVTLSPAALNRLDDCCRIFLLGVVILLLRRVGWHHVHAATAIDPKGRGWLFAGNAMAGKSTTAAWCATRGWAVGTDDTAFLAAAGSRVEVVAARGPLALRDGGKALLSRPDGTPLPSRGKTGYRPEDLGGHWAPRIRPDIIAFSAVGTGATETGPISPRETLAALVRWSAWVLFEPSLADEHLGLLSTLAGQTRSLRLTLGPDLFAPGDRLMELVP